MCDPDINFILESGTRCAVEKHEWRNKEVTVHSYWKLYITLAISIAQAACVINIHISEIQKMFLQSRNQTVMNPARRTLKKKANFLLNRFTVQGDLLSFVILFLEKGTSVSCFFRHSSSEILFATKNPSCYWQPNTLISWEALKTMCYISVANPPQKKKPKNVITLPLPPPLQLHFQGGGIKWPQTTPFTGNQVSVRRWANLKLRLVSPQLEEFLWYLAVLERFHEKWSILT